MNVRYVGAPDTKPSREDVIAALADGPVRFVEWSLAQADLTRLNFHGCIFERCRGAGANFSFSDLAETRFLACDFNNARFAGATLSAAHFSD